MTQEKDQPIFCETCGAQLPAGSRFCHQCGMKVAPLKENDAGNGKKEPGKEIAHKLYHVYSVVNNFPYQGINYDNLKINWYFVGREEPQVPCEEVIADYWELSLAKRVYPENFIKELFTREEAEQLKSYLDIKEKASAVIEPCKLPVSGHASGYRDYPPPKGTDFFLLHNRSEYNLPFKVEGVFNIKMADQRVVADNRTTVVSGISIKEIRKQLNIPEKPGEKT